MYKHFLLLSLLSCVPLNSCMVSSFKGGRHYGKEGLAVGVTPLLEKALDNKWGKFNKTGEAEEVQNDLSCLWKNIEDSQITVDKSILVDFLSEIVTSREPKIYVALCAEDTNRLNSLRHSVSEAFKWNEVQKDGKISWDTLCSYRKTLQAIDRDLLQALLKDKKLKDSKWVYAYYSDNIKDNSDNIKDSLDNEECTVQEEQDKIIHGSSKTIGVIIDMISPNAIDMLRLIVNKLNLGNEDKRAIINEVREVIAKNQLDSSSNNRNGNSKKSTVTLTKEERSFMTKLWAGIRTPKGAMTSFAGVAVLGILMHYFHWL